MGKIRLKDELPNTASELLNSALLAVKEIKSNKKYVFDVYSAMELDDSGKIYLGFGMSLIEVVYGISAKFNKNRSSLGPWDLPRSLADKCLALEYFAEGELLDALNTLNVNTYNLPYGMIEKYLNEYYKLRSVGGGKWVEFIARMRDELEQYGL